MNTALAVPLWLDLLTVGIGALHVRSLQFSINVLTLLELFQLPFLQALAAEF